MGAAFKEWYMNLEKNRSFSSPTYKTYRLSHHTSLYSSLHVLLCWHQINLF